MSNIRQCDKCGESCLIKDLVDESYRKGDTEEIVVVLVCAECCRDWYEEAMAMVEY